MANAPKDNPNNIGVTFFVNEAMKRDLEEQRWVGRHDSVSAMVRTICEEYLALHSSATHIQHTSPPSRQTA